MNWINGIKLKIIWLCEYILSFIVFVISIFKKMKKPAITGMLAAGLLVAPGNKANAVPMYAARAPPTYADEYLKKEYPYEWKMIMKAWEEATTGGTSWPYEEAAISALKKRYKKDKKPETLYLLVYSIYSYAGSMPSFKETEYELLKALEDIEKELKERPNELFLVDLKLAIHYNSADTYYRAYKGDQLYEKRGHIDQSEKDLYKKKALKHINKFNAYAQEIEGRMDQLQPGLFSLSEEDKKQYLKEWKEDFQGASEYIKRIQAELQNENNK